jgi:hypothetical protein
MTSEKLPDDDVFINSNFPVNGPIQKTGVRTNMINSVSSASAVSQAVLPQITQAKAQQASASESLDSVQLSSKAQAQASGDVDHDGDSH